MSTHIGAQPGQIAPTVLLPGDPLRAQWIAETYLDDVEVYNRVRGMYGATGTYKGTRVSVQGSGMGMPSLAIYVTELLTEFDVQNVIRVGSAGGLTDKVELRDLVIAMTASSDSHMNKLAFDNWDFAPCADFGLLRTAVETAEELGLKPHVGPIVSNDSFYPANTETIWKVAAHGALAVEMETTALYTIAARYGRKALTILTISDHLKTGGDLSAEDRERSFADMAHLTLETVRKI